MPFRILKPSLSRSGFMILSSLSSDCTPPKKGFRRMEEAVAYLRVSAEGHGRSGLGLEAQRDVIARFAEREGAELVHAA